MASYREKLEEFQRAAQEKLQDINKQYGISEKLEEGAKTAYETAQKGADVLKEGVEKLKVEVEKSDAGKQAVRVAEDTYKTAEASVKQVWEASEPARGAATEVVGEAGEKAAEAVKTASEKAGEILHTTAEKAGDAFTEASDTFKKTTKTASDVFNFSASFAKTFDAAARAVRQTGVWITEYPLQAAATGASVVVGAGLGAGFTLLGSNWFFRSALPFWGVQALSDRFLDHLKSQEEMLRLGDLSEAEVERVKFEREIVKYAGAPLLGAFSCAAGAVMWSQIFSPRAITGAPVSWLLGGNPLLEGVWLFGNGLICFKIGYEFFMVSLEDQSEVQRIVKEIKGMLPQAA